MRIEATDPPVKRTQLVRTATSGVRDEPLAENSQGRTGNPRYVRRRTRGRKIVRTKFFLILATK